MPESCLWFSACQPQSKSRLCPPTLAGFFFPSQRPLSNSLDSLHWLEASEVQRMLGDRLSAGAEQRESCSCWLCSRQGQWLCTVAQPQQLQFSLGIFAGSRCVCVWGGGLLDILTASINLRDLLLAS